MKRIQLGEAAASPAPAFNPDETLTGELGEEPASYVTQGVIRRPAAGEIPHALFAPMHYEENYGYPLVVWLHGPADDERQLLKIMPLVSLRNYAAIGPRGVRPAESGRGYTWQDSATAATAAAGRVFDCLEIAGSKFNIDTSRVFLAGYDCGGTLALRIAMKHPRQFAGAISLGGPFPVGDSPLANIDEVRRLPLLIAQGSESEKYPEQKVCDELRLFHAAGMGVTLRQYPGDDYLCTQMLQDMDAWIMQQITG